MRSFVALLLCLGLSSQAVAQTKARRKVVVPTVVAPTKDRESPAAAGTATVAPDAPATSVDSALPAAAAHPARSEQLGAVIVVGLGVHSDDGTMRGSDRRSIQVTDETFDFSGQGRVFGTLGFLTGLRPRVRGGMSVRYFGGYEYSRSGGRAGDGKLGQLGEAVAQLQYVLPMYDRWDLVLGAEAGAALLVPGGAFQKEIQALQTQGASVWDVPRVGYLLGPQLAARYKVGQRLFVRGDLGLTWEQLFLFFTHDDVGAVQFEKTRRANIIRYALTVSLEVPL